MKRARARIFRNAGALAQAGLNPARAGVIPYVKLHHRVPSVEDHFPFTVSDRAVGAPILGETAASAVSTVWFAMGVDAAHGELTDFGGRRGSRESVVRCAARELLEESAGIFDYRARDRIAEIENSPVVSDGTMAIFLLKVPSPVGFPYGLSERYSAAMELSGESARLAENSDMYWIPECEMAKLLSKRTVRHPPTDFHASTVPKTLSPGEVHPCVYENVRRRLSPRWRCLLDIILDERD